MRNSRTIGIGLVEHMGDIVACEPVARHLRSENPDAHIAWCVRAPYRELIETNPNVDETLVMTCCTEWIALSQSGYFDEVVDLHINGRVCPTCRVPLVKTRGNLDVAELTYFSYGGLLTAFSIGAGLPPLTDAPRVYIPDAAVTAVDALALPPSFVALHAKTNEQVKDWQPEKWLQLARHLTRDRGLTVVEIGTEPVLPAMPGLVQLCGRTSILGTAEVIRRAALFIGVDSGPSHLANAVETFGVILLGPYKVFTKYNPYSGGYATGSNCRIVYGREGVGSILADDVIEAAAEALQLTARMQPSRAAIEQFETRARQVSAGTSTAPASKVIAFYLPQFHPIPENDAWWGKGFTEWRNTANARPLFPGHYQPHVPGELGFYDLRLPEAREAQAALARTYGVDAFCYWHYWFNGKKLLERPLEEMLASGKPDFPFCLAWANESWTRRWDGAEKQVLQTQEYGGELDIDAHFTYLLKAFQDSRYLTVEGKPIFLVYRPMHLAGARRMLDRWRELARQAGLPGLFLLALRTVFERGKMDYPSLGFDGVVQHQPNWELIFQNRRSNLLPRARQFVAPNSREGQGGRQEPIVLDARESVAWFWELNNQQAADPRTYPTVVCSWDNTPRVGRRATLLHQSSPEDLAVWLALEMDRLQERPAEHRLLFLNAWNEWAEGMHLEPDLRHGTTLLEAVQWAKERGRHLNTAFSRKTLSRIPVAAREPRENPAEPVSLDALPAALAAIERLDPSEPDLQDRILALMAFAERRRAALSHEAASLPLNAVQKQELEILKNASARLHAALASTHIAAGAYERADMLFLKALTISAAAVRVPRAAALCMAREGYLGVAAELISGLVQDHPGDLDLWSTLGSLLASMKRVEEARRVFERVLQVQPGNRQAKLFLKQHAPAPEASLDLPGDIGPFYLHCGGIGDALLLLAAACKEGKEPVTIVSISQSPAAVDELFAALPCVRRVHHLPWPPSIQAHQALRRVAARHPQCLGMGTTPAGDYFAEWREGLDIFGHYGVDPSPAWARAFNRPPVASPQVVLQPAGGRSPLTGERKAFSPAEWQRLVEGLAARGIRPLVIGHHDERPLYPAGPADDRRDLPLREQMELVASAGLVVGADSWAKTFAALCGVPALVLHSTRGKTVGGLSEAGDNVFLKPWQSIAVFADFDRLLEETLNRLTPSGSPSPRRLAIVWEGSQFVHHSLALINRELSVRLIEAGHQLSIVPYEPDEFTPPPGSRYAAIAGRVHRLLRQEDVHVRHQWPPNLTPPPRGHWVMIQPWEFGSLPKTWIPALTSQVDDLWVPSRYVRDVALADGIPADRVAVVPNGVDASLFSPAGPAYPLSTRKRFRFLFVGGTIHRKGIDVLLKTYLSSFSREDDTCLVVKDMGGTSFYQDQTLGNAIQELACDPRCPEIEYIDRHLTPEEMASLYRACQALVHPYRGEGFGLPVLEAMACGLPAIVTRGGACDDFCTAENSLPVGAERRTFPRRAVGDLETFGTPWLLEPHPADLLTQMRLATVAPDMLAALGRQARSDVEAAWTWDHALRTVEERLTFLVQRPVRRFSGPAAPAIPPAVDLQQLTALFQQGDFSGAMEAAARLSASLESGGANEQSRPLLSGLRVFMGQCALAQNDLDQAKEQFEKALELSPESSPACAGLGEVFSRAGLAEASKTMFEWAVRNDPQNETARIGLAAANKSLSLPSDDDRLAAGDNAAVAAAGAGTH